MADRRPRQTVPPRPSPFVAVVGLLVAAGMGTPCVSAAQGDVKRFHGRELKETTYKGTTIRYFLESFSVARQKLQGVVVGPAKGNDVVSYSEYMGEVGMDDRGSYIRCDVHMFDEGDKEKWIYRRSGAVWVWHRVFHPSRKGAIKLDPGERLLDRSPSGEVIVESSIPQLNTPEEYVRWMAISVSRAKEPEIPLGQHLPMVKHIVVTE